MIKLPRSILRPAGVAVALTALCSLSVSAASLDNWTQYSGTPIDGLNTNHPVIGSGAADSVKSHTLYSVTNTYTLANVGDSVSFTGNANFQGVGAAQADQFRFGVYDSNGTSPGTGAANVSGWLGYFATNAGIGGTGDQRSRLWKRPDPNTVSFGSNGWSNPTATAWAGSPGSVLISGDYSFSMVLTKTADGINVSWSLIGLDAGATYSIIGSYLDTSANTTTFDRVGIFVGGSLAAERLSFSDLEINFAAIPEPSTTVAFLGLAVVGAVLLRRRVRRA